MGIPHCKHRPRQLSNRFASGRERAEPGSSTLHTNFQLSASGSDLLLIDPEASVINSVSVPAVLSNVSFSRKLDTRETWVYFLEATPGSENNSFSYDQVAEMPMAKKQPVIINEFLTANRTSIPDEDGNLSGYPVNLENYGLSDSKEQPHRWQFTTIVIMPGEYLLLFASGKDRCNLESPFLHTNFKIRASGETLVLSHPSGMTIDQLPTGKHDGDLSAGLLPGNSTKRYFMENPSPGEENRGPFLDGYTMMPQISPAGGFYNQPFEAIIIPPGSKTEVRYTLDGSEPTAESPLYTAPLWIEETAVLRARAFSEDAMPGPVTSCSYFFNTDHELTVVSVMMEPDDLWNPTDGIYVRGYNASNKFPYYGANFWKDIEKPIYIEMSEPDGTLGWGMNAGIKIGGQYSRAMDQKIFNVFFRNIYGHNEIRYPLFEDKDLTLFKALTLRTSGQDALYSKIRDIMMTSLLEVTGLDYQAHRQAVLYLNGEYWGIYNIRERANRYMVAHNHGLDPDRIDLLQGNWRVRAGSNEEYLALLDFVRNNNLSLEENYAYVRGKMDITNYIDALVEQVYFAQTDQGNIRYWREQSNEVKWRWLVYDLDWAFWPGHLQNNTLAAMISPAVTGV